MGSEPSRSKEPQRGSADTGVVDGSIDPFSFEWRRSAEAIPLLERLQRERGDAALWRFGVMCVEPLRNKDEIMPLVLAQAAAGFTEPGKREEIRRAFGGTACGASMIGVKNLMPGAAAFLAGFRLLDERPTVAVAEACACVRAAYAFRKRLRALGELAVQESLLDRAPLPTETIRVAEDAQATRPVSSIGFQWTFLRSASSRRGDSGRRGRSYSEAGLPRELLLRGRDAAVQAEAVVWRGQLALLESMLAGDGAWPNGGGQS